MSHYYHDSGQHAEASDTDGADDIWGDDSQDEVAYDRRIADQNWTRLQDTHGVEGYKEGIDESKEQYLQEGFDAGYREGFRTGFEVGRMTGTMSALQGMIGGGFDLVKSLDEQTRAECAALLETLKGCHFEQLVRSTAAEETCSKGEQCCKQAGRCNDSLDGDVIARWDASVRRICGEIDVEL
ncbi:uncharacterized protein BJ171DRAFT_595118 [Polychytrium aggregatum]|uniref:uncharacterized protein n=1 Tax=Polychytrium aggregatum TaxID=110093 RepID=UPI0022FED1A2|nr:uncharacterized protein BJ171DRAFT_595118 [Polychytrium aggregatum]KAI9209369.1 hypothetical protein BJ171DRAFT_595118 [Polychytrium aggregatum]